MGKPIIVLHQQSEWHGYAGIEGNRAGLEQLASALEAALSLTVPPERSSVQTVGEVTAPDGEYFELRVLMHTELSAAKLPTAYTGLPARIENDRLKFVLEQIQKMADLGNTTGIDLQHVQSKLREIQRMAAKALEGK